MPRTTLRIVKLSRWLGPWASDTAAPRDVQCEEHFVARSGEPNAMKVWFLKPTSGRVDGAVLLVQGLHHQGPADPRLERFARILAHAGWLVAAPFLPDFARLRVGERLRSDALAAFEALLARPDLPQGVNPGVFSISFGSLPALAVTSSDLGRERVGRLVIFGGYASFEETIRFSLGESSTPHDPLNRPVIFLNLLDGLPSEVDKPALAAAWTTFVHRTWGKPEMREPATRQPVADECATDLKGPTRELFLQGAGLAPGGEQVCLDALARARGTLSHADPTSYLSLVRCQVHIVHGRDDDVIPAAQAETLARALPPEARPRVYLTGLYGHTQSSVSWFRGAAETAREVKTMLQVLRVLATFGCRPE